MLDEDPEQALVLRGLIAARGPYWPDPVAQLPLLVKAAGRPAPTGAAHG